MKLGTFLRNEDFDNSFRISNGIFGEIVKEIAREIKKKMEEFLKKIWQKCLRSFKKKKSVEVFKENPKQISGGFLENFLENCIKILSVVISGGIGHYETWKKLQLYH